MHNHTFRGKGRRRQQWFCAMLCALLTHSLLAAEPARIDVFADQPGVRISPVLYGIFFEEINRAGEGGLWAEMLVNPSFEDAYGAPGWTIAGAGKMAIDSASPTLNANNPTTLRLDLSNGQATLTNKGFKAVGLAVRKDAAYRLSFHARTSSSSPVPVMARLVGAGGSVLAEQKLRVSGSEFQKLEAVLTASGDDPSGRLELVFTGPGAVWIDMVSLFPRDTWKGHGLRMDLATMLADLKPSFVRFPGGCFVEGNQLANAVRWKETIGDPALRIGTRNLWGYRVNNAFGYHEFLQWCEDLGAAPMYVINCGMAHDDWVSREQAQEYVQDALDAIEYANGPATSKWGAARARNGHPAPFGLKYLEIGNENWHPQIYLDRFKQFRDAIKAKYPDIVLISNIPVAPIQTDMIDDHYYNSPQWFLDNAGRYDNYDRKAPKIYVGEYAVTREAGEGNLAAAIGEAAFMTGLERNSDVVAMASYAPLLCNPEWKRWNPNLIVFDQGRAYGTPSYFVQQMFSAHRGDVVLKSEAAGSTPIRFAGSAGLGSWNTQAEFKDIEITADDGRVLYRFDPSKELEGWRTRGGRWAVKDGAIQQTGAGENIRLLIGDRSWQQYTIKLKARKLGGDEGFLVLFQTSNGAKSWANFGGWGNTRHGIESGDAPSNGQPGSIETGRWYDIRVEISGPQVKAYLDEKLVAEVTRPSQRKLMHIVASRVDATGEIILKAVNPTDESLETTIHISGAASIAPAAKATVLSGRPSDENSFDQPTKIKPREVQITNAASSFPFTFEPHSVVVMRLQTSR